MSEEILQINGETYTNTVRTSGTLGKARGTMQNWRSAGTTGPEWVRIGSTIYYAESAILAWIKANTVTPGNGKAKI